MTEHLKPLIERAEAALNARIAEFRSLEAADQLARESVNGCIQLLEDRRAQCASWLFTVERGRRVSEGLESDIRDGCLEFLRMVGEA
jgi:hypothetical protein